MSQAIDAVLAGTKGFAVALLAPLTARIGNRPRVAGDPSQVLGLCSGPSALAVVEFMGEGSLPTIQALVRDGRGLRIVAGVPVAHAGAEGTLRALGVEVGRWDGKTDGVISAVERAVAAMAAPRAAPARPAASVVPAASGPARPPAAAAPRAASPPPSAAPRPAAGVVSPPARPAAAAPAPAGPARPAAPAAAAAAPRPAPPLAPQGAAPAARPPAAPPPARPASPPAAHAQPAAAAPRPGPAAPPPHAARPPEPRPAPAAKPPAPAPVPAPVAAQPRPAANFFDDLDADVNVDIADLAAPASPEVNFHAAGVYVPPPTAPGGAAWPSGLSTPAQAEDALQRALRETADPGRPLHALALRTLETLSDLERAVLAGEPQPIDAAPIRKAAVMRLRVAEALASAPPQGSTVDSAALSAMMGEIDGLLAEVAPLLTAAPAELAPALESIRNALVAEAIDFSEAASRASSAKPGAPDQPRNFSAARASQARVLSMEPESDLDRRDRRRRVGMGVLLGVVLVGALGFHGYRYWQRAQLAAQAAPPPFEAPAGYQVPVTTVKGPVVLHRGKGGVDAAALQRFREAQEAQGKQVFEMENGTLIVVPAGTPPPAGVRN